ncbi:hypothetical protein P7K49_027832 [Saguinus oedipus]|uniref:Uncharacterized protein n=1 Tax=Saguinus oedipus TaxID=9490 RepID=A0ABQ9UAJ9_SAGOE|nr:hypothetical protein P7K49_027832 [Saguinus oedipus]
MDFHGRPEDGRGTGQTRPHSGRPGCSYPAGPEENGADPAPLRETRLQLPGGTSLQRPETSTRMGGERGRPGPTQGDPAAVTRRNLRRTGQIRPHSGTSGCSYPAGPPESGDLPRPRPETAPPGKCFPLRCDAAPTRGENRVKKEKPREAEDAAERTQRANPRSPQRDSGSPSHRPAAWGQRESALTSSLRQRPRPETVSGLSSREPDARAARCEDLDAVLGGAERFPRSVRSRAFPTFCEPDGSFSRPLF